MVERPPSTLWHNVQYDPNEIQAGLAWNLFEALCRLPGLRGSCWRRVCGKSKVSLTHIAKQFDCSEELITQICSDVVRQLLVMGFRPIAQKPSPHE